MVVLTSLSRPAGVIAQTAPKQTPPATESGAPPVSLNVLIDQAVARFPVVRGDVVDAKGSTLTLSAGRKDRAQVGLALEVYREGREIRHPRTGQVLGNTEQTLGRAVVTQVFDGYSLATFEGQNATAGDRVRTSPDKVKLTLLPFTGPGVKQNLVEAATNEIYEGLARSGRFNVLMGDQVAVWLTQQKIAPEDFLQGRGVSEASGKLKLDNVLILYYKVVDRRPFIEARLYSEGRSEAALTTAFFVPSSIRPVQPGRFSASDRAQPDAPERKPRSLLARLLGWGAEPNTYSTGETSIPLKEIGRFAFAVASMDVAVAPADQIPRVVVTDGDRIFLYKIVNRALEPEWTFSERSIGRIFSVQLADIGGDGVFRVVVNRFDTKVGMNAAILGLRDGKPAAIVDHIDSILIAMDENATGVKQSLWAQGYDERTFFRKGADKMVLRNNTLVKERTVAVPDQFRATGAVISNITGKGQQAIAYIDSSNRLRISAGPEEIWTSSTQIGGGGPQIEVVRFNELGGRSYFYRPEPIPLAIDLDGDGIQELIVPQNQAAGMLAVVYRGPAGYRFQQLNSGFEGVINAIGGFPGDEGSGPTLIAAVVRYRSALKTGGETQLIMTLPE